MIGMERIHRIVPAILVTTSFLGACVPEDQRTETIDQETWAEVATAHTPEVRAQIDSANTAYKAGDYPGSLGHYQAAIELDDEVAAAWFGVYMAHHAMGDLEEANRALERARNLLPGASLLRENEAPPSPPDPDGEYFP